MPPKRKPSKKADGIPKKKRKTNATEPRDAGVIRQGNGQVGAILQAPRASTSAMPDVVLCADDDITAHIPNQLREKIWGHQYVNLALLLKGSAELTDFYTASNLVLNESGCLESRPKVLKDKIPSIEKWTDAFLLFTNIYLRRYPERAVALTQYMSVIRDAAAWSPGFVGVPMTIRKRSDGILFIHEDGSPLPRYQFNAVLRKSIIKLGLPVSVFSFHSFRIGAATTLALKGFFVDVWILGSSIIYWACRMANRLLSRHLRLEHLGVHISWFGKRGMIWEDVLLTVSHKLTYLSPPKFSSYKKAIQTQLDTTMDIKAISVFKYHYLSLNIHVCQLLSGFDMDY
ncbi:hypothetical protein KUTeg_006972 [Tegillarca granosa]|uniref:Tyr recombinase domain-containing protein n=1 Tax=Tegillarca granosa TaxID=220873 RepID=A0ABQ9FE92_TEGGR|nr:hypothetical protein KUTeg_006972 [Tegillarca granosa]